MKFYEVLVTVAGHLLLVQRLPYQALRRDLGLNEQEIEDVRAELVFCGVAHDEDGKGLVCTGGMTTRDAKRQVVVPV
jgi:hypothetical protein